MTNVLAPFSLIIKDAIKSVLTVIWRRAVTNQDASKAVELATVLGRLAVVGVRVEELLTPLLVADYVPYGRTQRAQTLAAGTFVISTAQPAKHFIQSMLNEGTYVPFPYFYDLTGCFARKHYILRVNCVPSIYSASIHA